MAAAKEEEGGGGGGDRRRRRSGHSTGKQEDAVASALAPSRLVLPANRCQQRGWEAKLGVGVLTACPSGEAAALLSEIRHPSRGNRQGARKGSALLLASLRTRFPPAFQLLEVAINSRGAPGRGLVGEIPFQILLAPLPKAHVWG